MFLYKQVPAERLNELSGCERNFLIFNHRLRIKQIFAYG